jgi:hypothetical protein
MQFFIWNILILILCVFSGDVIMDVNFANIGKNFETALINCIATNFAFFSFSVLTNVRFII